MAADALHSALYPRRCPVCGGVPLQRRGGRVWLCDKCEGKLSRIKQPSCFKCGKQLEDEESEYCRDCTVKRHSFDRGVAAFNYTDSMKKSMYAFKYNNRREYAGFYAETLFREYGRLAGSWQAEAIIPVPLHPSRLRARGYNQAEALAKELGRRMGIMVDTETLRRVKKTLPQKLLNDRERGNNIENAFQIGKNSVKYKCVIVVDDIYTTGATMDGCALTLKAGGAERVYFMSVCAGKGF